MALIAAGALVAIAPAAAAAPQKPKPKPKPPRITLLTSTEQGALRREAIKLAVESRRGDEVGVQAQFVIDGYPDDFPFRLGPEHKRLKRGEANVRFDLSPRQLEVLDFAIKSCRGATLAITAKVDGRTGSLSTGLRLPSGC